MTIMTRILERKIGDGVYTIVPLPSRAGGLKMYRKLHGYVVPVVGRLTEVVGIDDDGDLALKVERIEDALPSALKVVETLGMMIADDTFGALIDEMLAACTYNKKKIDPDHWDEHMPDHDEVVACLLWVNFLRPFLDSLTRLPGSGKVGLSDMSRLLQTLSQSTRD